MSSRSQALTGVMPATWSSVNGDSTKSSSPWHSRSISSFLILPSHSDVMRLSLPSASAMAVRAPTRLRPVRRARKRLHRDVALAPADPETATSRAPSGRRACPLPSGSGRCSAAACGFSTTSALRSCRPSLRSTVTMLDWTIAGSFAQPRTLTMLAANGPPSWSASPRGTTNSANSMMMAMRFALAAPPGSACRFSVRSR